MSNKSGIADARLGGAHEEAVDSDAPHKVKSADVDGDKGDDRAVSSLKPVDSTPCPNAVYPVIEVNTVDESPEAKENINGSENVSPDDPTVEGNPSDTITPACQTSEAKPGTAAGTRGDNSATLSPEQKYRAVMEGREQQAPSSHESPQVRPERNLRPPAKEQEEPRKDSPPAVAQKAPESPPPSARSFTSADSGEIAPVAGIDKSFFGF